MTLKDVAGCDQDYQKGARYSTATPMGSRKYLCQLGVGEFTSCSRYCVEYPSRGVIGTWVVSPVHGQGPTCLKPPTHGQEETQREPGEYHNMKGC